MQDAAVSLASKFADDCRDDEIVARLTQLVDCEDAGLANEARRHLTFVRRKVTQRVTKWRGQIAVEDHNQHSTPKKEKKQNG